MSAAPRPGWYPDPAGTPELYRWWDGGGWTAAISESPQAPSPRLHSPADDEPTAPRPRHSRVRVAIALLLCVALFLTATVGAGWLIWHEPRTLGRTVNGPAGAPATETSRPMNGLDVRTRVARIDDATLTLPGTPYTLVADSRQLPGVLDTAFVADATVHTTPDAGAWSATVLFARLDAGLAGPDLEATGAATLDRLATTMFGSHPTQVSAAQTVDHSVDGFPGVLVTAEVHYEIDGLPSRFDRMTALLVALDADSVVLTATSVPDDADQTTVDAAAASLATLRIG